MLEFFRLQNLSRNRQVFHMPLKEFLEKNNTIGVEGVDTRALTRYIRDYGARKAIITTADAPIEQLIKKVKKV